MTAIYEYRCLEKTSKEIKEMKNKEYCDKRNDEYFLMLYKLWKEKNYNGTGK